MEGNHVKLQKQNLNCIKKPYCFYFLKETCLSSVEHKRMFWLNFSPIFCIPQKKVSHFWVNSPFKFSSWIWDEARVLVRIAGSDKRLTAASLWTSTLPFFSLSVNLHLSVSVQSLPSSIMRFRPLQILLRLVLSVPCGSYRCVRSSGSA